MKITKIAKLAACAKEHKEVNATVAPSGDFTPLLLANDWEDATALDSSTNDATLAASPAHGLPDDDTETPGAERERDTLGAAGPSVNGLSPIHNNELLDGLTTTQSFRSGPRGGAAGGPRTAASFGAAATGSLRVLPHSFSAQYGGAAGGIIAVTSREASQRLHGSAYFLDRQSALAATNPFAVVTHYRDGVIENAFDKPQDQRLQFGGTVGVPLKRLHLPARDASLFLSLEGQLRSGQIVSSPATASFYALSAEQLALLANRGASPAATNIALDYLDSLSGTQSRNELRLLSFARLDARASARDRLTLGYIGNRFHSPSGTSSGSDVIARGRASFGISNVAIDAGTWRWAHTFSAHSANELRGQLAHDLESEMPHAPLAQEPGIGPGGFAPEVSIAPNGFAYGSPASLGRQAYPDETRLELADTWTLTRGRHTFTAGADWSRVHDRIASVTNSDGTFLYDSGTTNGRNGGLVDWITDYTFNVHAYPNGACPSIVAADHLFCFRSYTQSFGGAESEFVTHELAGFGEDTMRFAHGFALTFGVRYEYMLLPLPQQPNPALDQVLQTIDSPASGTTSLFPEDRNNLGPRVALAWSPGRKHSTTVQIGYGVFYGRVPGATINAALTETDLDSSTRRIRIVPSTTTLCPQVQDQGFGYPCAYTTEPPAAVAQTSSATVFARSFRLPAVQRATLSLEHAWRRGTFLRASYVMANATQLPQSVDLNIAPSTSTATFVLQGGDGHPGIYNGQTFVVPLYTARRSTEFGPVSALVSNANATYHAATVETRLRAASAFELRGSYTFARAIDYGPQTSATPRLNGQFDPFADGYDKGLSSLDFRHRFSGDLVLHTRLRHGPEAFRRTVSDWRLASIATAGSGAPYSYAIFGGTELTGGRETINGSGGAIYLPSIGRNTLRLPMRSAVDLRLARDFAVHKARLSAFAEAFNLLNTQSLSRVETRAFLVGTPAAFGQPTPLIFQDAATIAAEGLTTPAFGTPTSSISGLNRERQLQLGLRLDF